jgi:glycosyltransferase involved in cell wall biosynthesis
MSQPIPVLHIIKSLGRGGAEILLPESLRLHDKEKYCFHYIYFLPWKDQVAGEIEKEGGRVTCLPAKGNPGMLRNIGKIVTYIRRHGIRVIHCHLPWAGIVGRMAGWITGVPVVYTEHNKWERYHPLTYQVNKLSFRAQEKVIAVSGDVACSIRKHYKGRRPDIEVIQNGIDTDKYAPSLFLERDIRKELELPAHVPVIGISCVFRVQKRLHIWLEVAKVLHLRHPEIFFILVGDGVLHDEIHQQVAELGLGSCIHFAGLQQDTRPYLKAMDIFMMTSEFEGLPVALLEAMSMGCLPACTAAGGIGEVIRDGENGLLVPVDHPMALGARLAIYLQDPLQMGAMRQAARATVVRSFSMRRMVDALESMYDALLAGRNDHSLIPGS